MERNQNIAIMPYDQAKLFSQEGLLDHLTSHLSGSRREARRYDIQHRVTPFREIPGKTSQTSLVKTTDELGHYYLGVESSEEGTCVDLQQLEQLAKEAHPNGPLNQYQRVSILLHNPKAARGRLMQTMHLFLEDSGWHFEHEGKVYSIDHDQLTIGQELYPQFFLKGLPFFSEPSPRFGNYPLINSLLKRPKPSLEESQTKIAGIIVFDTQPIHRYQSKEVPETKSTYRIGNFQAVRSRDANETILPFSQFVADEEQKARAQLALAEQKYQQLQLQQPPQSHIQITPPTQEQQVAAESLRASRELRESEDRLRRIAESARYHRALVEALQTTGRMADIPYLMEHPGANYQRHRNRLPGPDHSDQLNG